ncbi:hypothetical protein BaRGS_00005334 [Batillaria attramentaria]|uniref:Uncharacterized protein n=1 Tax=Batillaria attramentaria TaxID=370345 RepID=A0ABD0LW33_9CAEN
MNNTLKGKGVQLEYADYAGIEILYCSAQVRPEGIVRYLKLSGGMELVTCESMLRFDWLTNITRHSIASIGHPDVIWMFGQLSLFHLQLQYTDQRKAVSKRGSEKQWHNQAHSKAIYSAGDHTSNESCAGPQNIHLPHRGNFGRNDDRRLHCFWLKVESMRCHRKNVDHTLGEKPLQCKKDLHYQSENQHLRPKKTAVTVAKPYAATSL